MPRGIILTEVVISFMVGGSKQLHTLQQAILDENEKITEIKEDSSPIMWGNAKFESCNIPLQNF